MQNHLRQCQAGDSAGVSDRQVVLVQVDVGEYLFDFSPLPELAIQAGPSGDPLQLQQEQPAPSIAVTRGQE